MIAVKKAETERAYDLKKYLHDHYQHKILVFDFWAMSLFLVDPLANPEIDHSHVQLSYGEFDSSVFSAYRNKIKSLTKGSDDEDQFLEFASANNALFIVTKERKEIFEKYAWEIYHKKFTFVAVDSACPVYDYSFCGLPYKYNFGVYKCVGPIQP